VSTSTSKLCTASASQSGAMAEVVRTVGIVSEEVLAPARSRASESASLLLNSRLDGGNGEDGGSVSDHKPFETTLSSSSSALRPWPVSSSPSDGAGSELAGVSTDDALPS
jgi:hypothetical protein